MPNVIDESSATGHEGDDALVEDEVEVEDGLTEEGSDDEAIPYRYDITSYGVDMPVDGLVQRIEEGDIYIPKWQRKMVWKLPQASRFVESLLLGLPVPGIFLAIELPTKKQVVIDGQQRLQTLRYFFGGVFEPNGREFALTGLADDSPFKGKTYESLEEPDRRTLNNSPIHAVMVRQHEPEDDDQSSIYLIFERLNTGGTQLHPQEIRNCIYRGEFNDLLCELNENDSWRRIYGRHSNRMKDMEFILRFFALYYDGAGYKKPMKQFLNTYMHRNQQLTRQSAKQLRPDFERPIERIAAVIGDRAFRPKKRLNAAVYEAVMVGLSRRLTSGNVSDDALRASYEGLMEDAEFENATETGTADEERVRARLELATRYFGG